MKNACEDKKMISPHNEWYIGNVLVCAHFSSKLAILFKTSFNKPDVDIPPCKLIF